MSLPRKQEPVLARVRLGLVQDGRRAGHVTCGKPEARNEYRVRNERVRAVHLARHFGTLTRVFFCGAQIVPLVADARQAKVRLACHPARRIANQFQDAFVLRTALNNSVSASWTCPRPNVAAMV